MLPLGSCEDILRQYFERGKEYREFAGERLSQFLVIPLTEKRPGKLLPIMKARADRMG